MIALALAASLLATPPTAYPSEFKFDRACMDEYARNLCDAEVLKGIRDRFEAPPVEVLAKDGWAGVRVYLIDGYSHDLPMVTIARKGDGPVEAETRALRPVGGPRVFRTEIGPWGVQVADLYAGLVRRSPDRITRPERKNGEPPSMCLHAWLTVTEVFDSQGVSRRIRNACDDDGLFQGGLEMSRLASTQLHDCGLLQDSHYRSHAQRIESCARLGGKPVSAAAQVRNLLEGNFLRAPVEEPPAQFAERFAPDASLQHGGQTLVGSDASVAGWTAAMPRDVRFQVLEVIAAGKKVQVRARLLRDRDGETRELAPVEQTWVQGKDYRWRMQSAVIGPYGPVKAN